MHSFTKKDFCKCLSELTQLLNELLVLVQLLQSLGIHAFDVVGLGFIAVLLVSQNADGHLRSGNIPEPHGSRETLIFLGIIVLQRDLELDGFDELPLLLLTLSKDSVNAFQQGISRDLTVLKKIIP